MHLSIDVGGTKTLLATFDGDMAIVDSHKFPTPTDYTDFTSQLAVEIKNICRDTTPDSVVIAMPGTIADDRQSVLSFGNLKWENIQAVEDVKKATKCEKVLLENDAKLAGLAEAWELRATHKRVLYVTVSTGIGLGLIVDGKIDHTVQDAGGRGLLMEHADRLMAWEEFASGKAIVGRTGKMASEITEEKDWYVVARDLAIGLIDVIVLLSPDCIVLGGGVGTHLDKYHARLQEELELYRHRTVKELPSIVKAKHPEEAVVYGGYLLAQ